MLINLGERDKTERQSVYVDSSMDSRRRWDAAAAEEEACCCRGGGKEAKEKSAKMAQVVPVDDVVVKEAELVVPYVMAVDDSSVDRAVITALLRRSKYKGTTNFY